MRTEARRPRCPVERWYWIAGQLSLLNVTACVRLTGYVPAGVLKVAAVDLAAEHPLLPVAVRAKAVGTNSISVSGELPWNLSCMTGGVSQQSTQRFADCCRRILLQAIA